MATRKRRAVLAAFLTLCLLATGQAHASTGQSINGSGTAAVQQLKLFGGGFKAVSIPASFSIAATKSAGRVHGTFRCTITGMDLRGSVDHLGVGANAATFAGASNFGRFHVGLNMVTRMLRLTWTTRFGPQKVIGTVEHVNSGTTITIAH